MENIEIKMINDEELREVSGGVEDRETNKVDNNYMFFPDDRIVAANYGFKSPCLHRVKIKNL